MARGIGDDGWVEVEVDAGGVLQDIADHDVFLRFGRTIADVALAAEQVSGAVGQGDVVEGEDDSRPSPKEGTKACEAPRIWSEVMSRSVSSTSRITTVKAVSVPEFWKRTV